MGWREKELAWKGGMRVPRVGMGAGGAQLVGLKRRLRTGGMNVSFFWRMMMRGETHEAGITISKHDEPTTPTVGVVDTFGGDTSTAKGIGGHG